MNVGMICSRSVDTAEEQENVQYAAQRMHARNVGALVVIDAQSHPVGIVTDRDLAVRVIGKGEDARETTVGQVMTRNLKTAREQQEIEDILRAMRTGPFRRMPVVNYSGQLVGIVTLDDIMQFLAGEFRGIDQVLQRESPRSFAETHCVP